jgi:hypothetical protein
LVVQELRTTTALRRASLITGLVVGLSATACGLETEAPEENESGSTHAVISIERSETADGLSSRGEALAGFLNVPSLVDADSVMSLVGLGLNLPEVGSCLVGNAAPGTGPLTETASVEFLEAGDVILEVAGSRERLAPYAFPTVTDSISGVLYTSRDRAADPLPTASRYTVSADGLGVRVAHDAPQALEGVTASGLPLTEVGQVRIDGPLDLTWSVGAAGDVVYAELVSTRRANRSVCAFPDELGAGSVPTESFAPGDTGHLLIHRLRTHTFEVVEGLTAKGQLRFDFALAASITFQ